MHHKLQYLQQVTKRKSKITLHGVDNDVDLEVACVGLRQALDSRTIKRIVREVNGKEGRIEFEGFRERMDSSVFDAVFREVQVCNRDICFQRVCNCECSFV
jgi:hypothetical protein